jgi:hypothetical protein
MTFNEFMPLLMMFISGGFLGFVLGCFVTSRFT